MELVPSNEHYGVQQGNAGGVNVLATVKMK
jgi:hypothetical protein